MHQDPSHTSTVGRIIDLERHDDHRGFLIAVQSTRDVPFTIQRIYTIYPASPDTRRGSHAHRTEKQLLICQFGSCKVLLDNGRFRTVHSLDNPGKGLLVDQVLWREMYDFSPDCVLLVLSDSAYDPDDYLYDYHEFQRYIIRGDGQTDD